MSSLANAPPPTSAVPPVVLVPLRDIHPALENQVRQGTSTPTVKTYLELYSEGYDFESPLELYRAPDGELKPWDGIHRFFAAQQAGIHELPCRIWPYSDREAILAAIRKNARHGLAFTNFDKRKVAEILLRDPEWADRPNREIARFMGVSHPFISEMKNEILGEVEIPEEMTDEPELPEDEPWGEEPGSAEDDPSFDHRTVSQPEDNGHAEDQVALGESAVDPDLGVGPAPAAGAVATVTSHAKTAEPAPGPGTDRSVYSAPQSDSDWLQSLPLSSKLKGYPFQSFRASALCYRRWTESDVVKAAYRFGRSLLDSRTVGKHRGLFEQRLQKMMATDHPKDWLLCVKCSGAGQLDISECDRCHGRGHIHG